MSLQGVVGYLWRAYGTAQKRYVWQLPLFKEAYYYGFWFYDLLPF